MCTNVIYRLRSTVQYGYAEIISDSPFLHESAHFAHIASMVVLPIRRNQGCNVCHLVKTLFPFIRQRPSKTFGDLIVSSPILAYLVAKLTFFWKEGISDHEFDLMSDMYLPTASPSPSKQSNAGLPVIKIGLDYDSAWTHQRERNLSGHIEEHTPPYLSVSPELIAWETKTILFQA